MNNTTYNKRKNQYINVIRIANRRIFIYFTLFVSFQICSLHTAVLWTLQLFYSGLILLITNTLNDIYPVLCCYNNAYICMTNISEYGRLYRHRTHDNANQLRVVPDNTVSYLYAY